MLFLCPALGRIKHLNLWCVWSPQSLTWVPCMQLCLVFLLLKEEWELVMLIHIAFRHYHQNNCQCKIIWDVFFFLVTKHHASQTAIPLLAMFENLNRIFSKVIVVVWPSELSSIRFRVSGYGIKILSCQTQESWVQPFQLVLEQISYLHWNERIYCQTSVGIDIMFIFFSFCLIFLYTAGIRLCVCLSVCVDFVWTVFSELLDLWNQTSVSYTHLTLPTNHRV